MKHLESQHQVALMRWARNRPLHPELYPVYPNSSINDYLIASANGGARNKREAARMKREGVKAGYPDLTLDIARNGYHGLRIELKKPKVKGQPTSYPSKLQKERIKMLNKAGYLALVCWGWPEAKTVIEDYLKL